MGEFAPGNGDSQHSLLPRLPRAVAANELAFEQRAQERYQQRFLGAIGVGAAIELKLDEDNPTLARTIEQAKAGDPEALSRARINIATAVAEGCTNDGYRSRVVKEIGPGDVVQQFGLTQERMHINSYALRPSRPSILKEYTKVEALNGHREEVALEKGALETHFMFVPSFVPDEVELTEEDLDYRGDGFFTRTMTFCLQATTKEGDKLVTEAVFRRGTAADEDAPFAVRKAQRYDLEAMGMVYEALGQTPPKTAQEFLKSPLLLRKEDFPNGVIDVLRMVDIASDVLQDKTGERTIGQYIEMIAHSERIDASLAGVREAVEASLFALDGNFEDPEDAIKALWELVRVNGSFHAVENRNIDPGVFGEQAKQRIIESRSAEDNGDILLRDQLRLLAVDEAIVTGCGGGSCNLKSVDPNSREGAKAESAVGVESGDIILKYTKGTCDKPDCKVKGQVYFVYNPGNPSRVKKFCGACNAKENSSKANIAT